MNISEILQMGIDGFKALVPQFQGAIFVAKIVPLSVILGFILLAGKKFYAVFEGEDERLVIWFMASLLIIVAVSAYFEVLADILFPEYALLMELLEGYR